MNIQKRRLCVKEFWVQEKGTSFSQERMQYLVNKAAVIDSAKGSNDRKVFDALDWIAA
ncbi:MAG: hypothetical protein ABSF48_05740 [Thermodesulfobacteriota bacterium]